MMPSCKHGTYTERGRQMSGSESKVIERHRQKKNCSADVFGHPGPWLGIFGVICCTKHGVIS